MSEDARNWLRCYRCWSSDLEVQVHYEGIHKIDPVSGERSEVVDEIQDQFWGDRYFAVRDLNGFVLAFNKSLPKS